MLLSIVAGERCKPVPRLRGLCPWCGAVTVAKCGSQKAWHWAHLRPLQCDPWWENETDWHRAWKAHFPEDCQEVVHVDSKTGERHIADVKTERGLVIEFQHSDMPVEELKSREAFYGHMIWIVDARSFASNFEIDESPLPHPKSALLDEIVFHSAQASAYFKREDLARGGSALYELHRAETIRPQILEDYRGHHFYKWKRAREVWLRASAPVFLDFGSPVLHRLMSYNPPSQRCVQRVSKAALIAKNGGYSPAPSSKA
jgi:hypothetical protein